ncbi:MAG: lipopolysaccharide transport periplasmic protein LptA [Hahellaceae bacterium]|nr:lipopolysaccharide transport periplasmic protein LptA [Hahellaceae bacterium]MCP5169038.1 lipopolysaccharide transport periplasmic protein LptA [Hahellaceae bacterium]
MNNSYIRAIAFLLFTHASSQVLALTSQSDAPIRIQSDTAELNAEKDFAIYKGDVIVTQNGSMLKAEKVIIYRSNGALNKIEAFGDPAQFSQPADETNPEIHAYGKVITYSKDSDTLKLEQNARFVQKNNSITGDVIEYDTQKRIAKASGNKASKERVDIIFNPTPKTESTNKSPAQ